MQQAYPGAGTVPPAAAPCQDSLFSHPDVWWCYVR